MIPRTTYRITELPDGPIARSIRHGRRRLSRRDAWWLDDTVSSLKSDKHLDPHMDTLISVHVNQQLVHSCTSLSLARIWYRQHAEQVKGNVTISGRFTYWVGDKIVKTNSKIIWSNGQVTPFQIQKSRNQLRRRILKRYGKLYNYWGEWRTTKKGKPYHVSYVRDFHWNKIVVNTDKEGWDADFSFHLPDHQLVNTGRKYNKVAADLTEESLLRKRG